MFNLAHLEFNQPILLAPMEDVTDLPFRLICKKFGADIVYTEFISSDNLMKNIQEDWNKFQFDSMESPVGIQIYGNRVDSMVSAAKLASQFYPDLLDINYGCPSKKVAGRGAGSGLLCNPELMETLTCAVVNSVDLPVTAKTRIGWNEDNISIIEIGNMLANCGVQALTIHGRTRSQKFKGKADWNWIKRAKEEVQIPIIGNGDVVSPQDVHDMFSLTNCDGVMIGRGAIGKPWIFKQAKHFLAYQELLPEPCLAERLDIFKEHLELSFKYRGPFYGSVVMGKHYNGYLEGLPDLKELKRVLCKLRSYQDIIECVSRVVNELEPKERLS